MREIARWLGRSPGITAAAGNGQVSGGALGAVVVPHRWPFREVQLWVEELVRADRRKDEFLATLAHELRTPLGAIRNAVDLLQREQGGTPAAQQAQALIERQVRHMTRLINDLLDVSRIRNGHLHLQRERIDLRAVLHHTVETLEPEVSKRRQQLTVALPESPVWLQADPWRLEQVFGNLLANASRYTDAGGELAVLVHVRNDQVVVRFRDSGIGIAPEALPHVFDLFTQADAAAPCSRAGLGIGLALVRSLVALHGGRVTAASAGLGRGSEFTVRLPLETGIPADQAAGDRSPA
jgi:signal transduction histidine kinase